MPLAHFLFRCPVCGHDPLTGQGDEVACPGCGTRFQRGGPGARIVVSEPGERAREVPAWELSEGIESRGGAVEAALDRDGTIRHEARVTARHMVSEEPVRFRGSLLGFCERNSPEERGILTVTGEVLSYRPDGATEPRRWSLLELRAVQTSSRSVQVRTPDGELLQFEFPQDSPRRWDELLRTLISRRWRQEGRGRITEFQPRITTR